MAARIGLCAAMLAATALAACSGGGGGSSSDEPTSGIASPGSITGASADYINSLNSELAIVNSDLVQAGRTNLPLSGTATYSGFGTIYDSSITTADNTALRLRGRSVVTDVSATANFGTRTVTITQDRFRNVDGAAVPGQVNWTTNYDAQGLFNATVSGNVGGTVFATGTDQARVGFYGDGSNSALLGTFSDAPVSTPSTDLRGSSISGDFAATRTGP
jgi:hypothetical protein